MTKTSTARAARRLKKREIAEKVQKQVGQMSPAEARKNLADWAAAGGDLKYLMDTGRIRYKPGLMPRQASIAEIAKHYAN